MRVVVTGSSSHLAQVLLPRLCASNTVSAVTGVDIRPGSFVHPRFHAVQADIRYLEPESLLPGHDALIHLAWIVLRGRMPLQRMRAINLDASRRWLNAAAQHGLPRIVHLSSASVYGRGEQMNEEAPFAPLTHFHYAQHKAELETWLGCHHPEIVRLRPHIILGDHAQPLLQRIISLPFYPALPDPQPQLQCVHENDVATAILQSLTQPVRGAYNLATPGSFSLRDAILGNRPSARPVPLGLAKLGVWLLWLGAGIGGEPGWVDGARHSLTLDCSKARRELDWQPEVSVRQMLKLS